MIKKLIKDWNDKKGVNVGVIFINFVSAILIGYGLGDKDVLWLVFIGAFIYFVGFFYYLRLRSIDSLK